MRSSVMDMAASVHSHMAAAGGKPHRSRAGSVWRLGLARPMGIEPDQRLSSVLSRIVLLQRLLLHAHTHPATHGAPERLPCDGGGKHAAHIALPFTERRGM